MFKNKLLVVVYLGNPMNWSISTRPLKIRRSSILKYGLESNKGRIRDEINGRNHPCGKISQQQKIVDRPLYPHIQLSIASKVPTHTTRATRRNTRPSTFFTAITTTTDNPTSVFPSTAKDNTEVGLLILWLK